MVCMFRHFLLDAGCSRLTTVVYNGWKRQAAWMFCWVDESKVQIYLGSNIEYETHNENARRLLIVLLC